MGGHHHLLARVEPGHALSERDDLGYKLVSKREGAVEGSLAGNDRTIQIAAPDSDRANDGFPGPFQSRVRRIPPFEHSGPNEDELSHSAKSC
jgi:hypothetical protein